MKAIVAIGGGEISTKSTLEIDKTILSLAKKDQAKVLFIPIASGDNFNYAEKFKEYYEGLGASVSYLFLSKNPSDVSIRNLIFSSDIIYIGGGNTAKMMRIFKRTKVNEYLKEAYNEGIILAGLSAGAMAFFNTGYSDSNQMINPEASLCEVKCLNLIPLCFCPHYNELGRETFDDFINKKDYEGIALENDVALLYLDENISLIKANKNAKGYFINKDSKKEIN